MKTISTKALIILVGLLAWVSLTPAAQALPVNMDGNDHLSFTLAPDATLDFYELNKPELQHVKITNYTKIALAKRDLNTNNEVPVAFNLIPLENQSHAIEVEDFDSHFFKLMLYVAHPIPNGFSYQIFELDPDERSLAIKSDKAMIVKFSNNGGGGFALQSSQLVEEETFVISDSRVKIKLAPPKADVGYTSFDLNNEDTGNADYPTQVSVPSAADKEIDFEGGGCSINAAAANGGPIDLMILAIMGLGFLLPLKKRLF